MTQRDANGGAGDGSGDRIGGAKGTGFRAAASLLRRNADFRRYYLAEIVSFGGDWFLIVALFSLVLDHGGTAMTLALTVVAQELPFFLMSPIGGALADRLDRKKLMIATDVARAVLCLGFLFVDGVGELWLAFVLLALISSLAAVFDPASGAAIPNLVDPSDLATANSLGGSAWGTMLAVGAGVGGLAVATFGYRTAFVVDALSFAGSALLLSRIARPFAEERRTEHPSVWRATMDTFSYANQDRRVWAFLSVKGGFGLAGGVLIFISIFAFDVFQAGATGIGILMAARGVGALLGPFIGRWIAGPDDKRLFTAIGLALFTFGISYAAFGLSTSLVVAAPLVMLAHFGGGTQWALSSYGLQKIVPDHIRGRVVAVDFALITLTFGISSVVAGFAADIMGPRLAAMSLACVAISWAGIWWVTTRRIRRAGV